MIFSNHAIFCSICGTCFCRISDSLLLSYLDLNSPYKLITDDDVLWLGHFRMLGRCPNVNQPSIKTSASIYDPKSETYFLSGPAKVRGSQVQLQRGSIVGNPFGEQCKIMRGQGVNEVLTLPASELVAFLGDRSRTERLLIVHRDCYEIMFSRVLPCIDLTSLGNQEIGVHTAHSSLCEPNVMVAKHCCDAEKTAIWRYNPMSEAEKAQWVKVRREFLCNPISSDWVLDYIHKWPLLMDTDIKTSNPIIRNTISGNPTQSSDPFIILPLDLILTVLDLLTIHEVLLLCIASPTVSQRLDTSPFWRRRITRDMPWLWDLELEDASSNTNWRRLYFDLKGMGSYDSQTRVLGLVNRKRIWRICLPIAQKIVEREKLARLSWTVKGHDAGE